MDCKPLSNGIYKNTLLPTNSNKTYKIKVYLLDYLAKYFKLPSKAESLFSYYPDKEKPRGDYYMQHAD